MLGEYYVSTPACYNCKYWFKNKDKGSFGLCDKNIKYDNIPPLKFTTYYKEVCDEWKTKVRNRPEQSCRITQTCGNCGQVYSGKQELNYCSNCGNKLWVFRKNIPGTSISFAIDVSSETVDEIINDILDRKGLGDEWASLDTNIQNEIKARWEEIIKECIRGVE